VNAGKQLDLIVVALLALTAPARAESARDAVRQGNRLYADGQYAEAINRYNEAEVEQPEALVPKFNKANSYYRLDDLGEAIDLYQEVAAESKDMTLVARAKYNLGNCFFQRGTKQRDSDLHKALQDMETSITYWRGVLDIDPKNEKAARNIEVARLTIKDILDQIKKQQQEQQQQQQQDQQGQQPNQDQQQGRQPQAQDPNQPQEQQPQGADQKQDPNQTEQQNPQDQQQQDQGQEPQQAQQQQVVPDATAQEILDKEQRQKEQRQILQRAATQKVEKDW